MKIVYFGKGERGARCLARLLDGGMDVRLLVLHPESESSARCLLRAIASEHTLDCIEPEDPNTQETLDRLAKVDADYFILGGYGKIVKDDLLALPRKSCLNLHGGALPSYRGSSPLNWVLIRGEREFGISIIEVDRGIDTGPLVLQKKFPIEEHYTIADLHEIANKHFPDMLVNALRGLESRDIVPREQPSDLAAYFPRRFPEDGFIVFDQMKAEEIINRIRALTDPYPGAFSYIEGEKVFLLDAEMPEVTHYGEPGRVYQVKRGKILVCALDRALWITRGRFENDSLDFPRIIRRYSSFATVRGCLLKSVESS